MPFDLLLSVARLGSLGLAAGEHGISQPAASTRIRRLERQLGVPLIVRSPRGSHLTAEGELVAEWARAAIDAAAALDAGVTSLRARTDAVLRVADDGRGLDTVFRPGVGLGSMRTRIENLHGQFRIGQNTPNGTLIEARLPRGDREDVPT